MARRFFARTKWIIRIVSLLALILGMLATPLLQRAAFATTVSDNFNRANGSLGSNWTTVAGTAAPQIVNDTLQPGTAGALNSAYWSANTFGGNQYAQANLPKSSGGNFGPGIAVRLSNSKGYLLWYGNSSSHVSLWRMDSATSWTQLKASGSLTVSPTDVWMIQAVGSTISGYQNGKLVVQATDTHYTTGSPGVWLYYAANQVTNWSGGDVAPTYSVGGSVSGLSGTVVLQDNGGDNLTVTANGSFTFATALASGAAYDVTVATNPAGQTCTVGNGTGTVGSANITNVAVTCTTNPPVTHSVGGTVTGLSGTVVLADNGGDNLTVTANGSFTFATALASGAAYNVTVATNPAGQTCTVTHGTGTVGSANITNVAVTCTNNPTYSVGGTVSGLTGTAVLEDNGGDALTVTAGGPFTFATALASGAAYSVTVSTSPVGQTCTVTNGSGTIASANVTNVAVACTTPAPSDYSVGGTISGLSGTAVLQDNGGDNLSMTANGSFTFATALASGAAYSVTVMTSPAGQTCSVTNGTGTIGVANVTSVTVTCIASPPPAYSVGGTVSGLSGTAVLQDNGGDNLTVTANGSFTFATTLISGAAYMVTVATNPAGQTCTVSNGSGTMAAANVTSVAVACTANSSGSASDNFNRANGPLGSNWTDMSDGGMTIASQAVAGGSSGMSGDMWTGSSFGSDQFSQVQLTSNQLTGGEWIGPAVRAQNGGQNLYLGIYFWNNGSPQLRLYLRTSGNWTQLGSSYNTSALPAGTTLELSATGTTISFLENGTPVITVTDSSLTGGAPGIMAYGTGQADNWSGGNMVAGPSYSVGGAVSGLSGTVVLQDNGGDALSISSNGVFTFATLVASGSNYTVTVANNPTGQTCSVASGSGTMGSGNVSGVAVTCANNAAGSGSDNFNRADGPLGPNWTDFSDGGLTITSQAVAGANASGYSGDMRTAEAYSSNQYSQIQLTGTQLTGGQWIGPAVRMQANGQDGYLGMYFWNSGSPEVMLFSRTGSTWNMLGGYSTGALAAGTTLKLEAVGGTLAFLVNGVERIALYDSTYTGGAPGIMAYGTPQADNWAGGTAGFSVDYLSTDANGVQTYDMISANNGYGPQYLRVLPPSNPAPGVAHNFLYLLPVEAGEGDTFGDGIATIESLNAQNQYDLTVIEPSFGIDPWYADNPNDANKQEETFMTTELQPWVKANLSTTGTEQHWLIGFSKSGIGGQDLLLKHPDLFTLAASWDFPADMQSYDEYGTSSAESYGTDANFQASYRLTAAFLSAHAAPFKASNRIWIGGYQSFEQDISDYDALLTSEGIQHTTETPTMMAHRWDSGWVPIALAALYQDSINLHG